MVVERARTDPRPAPPPRPVDEAALRKAVRMAIMNELAAASRTSAMTGRSPVPADAAKLVQWLAPIVRDLVIKSVWAALALRPGGAAGAATSPAIIRPVVAENQAGSASVTSPPSVPVVSPPGLDSQVALNGSDAFDAATAPYYPAAALADHARSPYVNGQYTIVVGPFDKFTQVRAFLEDVARIPRIIEARPKSFSGGQLVASVQSEYLDAQTLVDRLTTDLAPYRVVVRSVQQGYIELLVRQPAR